MLLHDPRLLFLDEPTLGLDPVGARELRDLLQRLHTEEKRTVLLTSHYMFEAARHPAAGGGLGAAAPLLLGD